MSFPSKEPPPAPPLLNNKSPESEVTEGLYDTNDHDIDTDSIQNGSSSNASSSLRYWQEPIVIGYAFGPKKMSTMGVVMAEASKARVLHDVDEEEEEEDGADEDDDHHQSNQDHDDDECDVDDDDHDYDFHHDHSLFHAYTNNDDEVAHSCHGCAYAGTTASNTSTTIISTPTSVSSCANTLATSSMPNNSITTKSSSSLTPAALHFLQQNQQTTIFSIGNSNDTNLKHIVRYFRSSCSSAASVSETSCSTPLTRTTSSGTYFSNTTPKQASQQHQQQQDATSRQLCSTSRRRRRYGTTLRLSFVPLDPDLPLEEQHGGKMHLILHKLTEDILACSLHGGITSETMACNPSVAENTTKDGCDGESAKKGSSSINESRRRINRLRQYQQRHPECCLVDDPANVVALMSRSEIAKVLQQCLKGVTSTSGIPVQAPKFVVCHDISNTTNYQGKFDKDDGNNYNSNDEEEDIQEVQKLQQSILEANISYPLIAKPLIAAGTKQSHYMAVLLRPCALKVFVTKQKEKQRQVESVSPSPSASAKTTNYILQEYMNHNEKLYKVYVLGDFVSVYQRSSLPNLPKIEPVSRSSSTTCDTGMVDSCNAVSAKSCCVEFDSQRPYPRLQDFGIRGDSTVIKSSDCHDSMDEMSLSGSAMKVSSSTPATITTTTIGPYDFLPQPEQHESDAMARSDSSYQVTDDEVRPIVNTLRKAFGLEVFGFDILITKSESGNPIRKNNEDDDNMSSNNDNSCPSQPRQNDSIMVVVDVNYFPSYKEVPNFPSLLANYLAQRVLQSRGKQTVDTVRSL